MNMNYSSTLRFQSNPLFRISTFRNEDVLIFEPKQQVSWIRISMVIISILLGMVTLLNLLLTYMKYQRIFKQNRFYQLVIPLILFLNIIFHVSHYAHNIYEPVGYFEPKHLYRKIIFSEMEQTFFFNFPLTILFMIVTRKVLLCCTKQQINPRQMLLLTILYSLLSMISGGHYTYEPPWNFSLIYNLTIAGETVVAFILMIMSVYIYRSNSKEIITYKYTRLGMNENSDMIIGQQRQSKSKISDDE
ncbi:hypothetical protein I4U23_001469 [Adineta vaga]|nr:hypothetical protein I4U23_001469 [Adineta vaga]